VIRFVRRAILLALVVMLLLGGGAWIALRGSLPALDGTIWTRDDR
jgi:hypothetical protein